MHILMVAAENDALPGGKVGGIGDVIRDLPPALIRQGQEVSVITPGYGHLSRNPGSRHRASFAVDFGGRKEQLDLFRVEPNLQGNRPGGPIIWLLENHLFSACGAGTIYCTRDREPFATDASKFALFSAGVAEALTQGLLGEVDVLHCHDWHAAPLLLLRAFAPRYRYLRELPAAYSIHNLSIQGVRPFARNRSSLESWFPDLTVDRTPIVDPRHTDCINWMRTGINLADKVHAVSPNYAREILLPTDRERHFIGGEGLESDLQRANRERRLIGLLNGCEYDEFSAGPEELDKTEVSQAILDCLLAWVSDHSMIPAAHFHALCRTTAWRRRRKADSFVVTSVGRINEQKNRLLMEPSNGSSVLEAMLDRLDNGFFIMLGSGDPDYEQFFTRVMASRDNFLFLQGYSDALASILYRFGDLFLMPSSFEPCGISQMLAMRAGTPCLVHAVGGLADTIDHGVNGFAFDGDDLQQQSRNLLTTFSAALELHETSPARWLEMCEAASAARFSWDATATSLLRDVYGAASPVGKRRETLSTL